ncbi:BQ2448_7120 [Microbotryum intermedium]|uniref:N-acetyl-D-glucosamine kinase n=1 Tax=Microbotryum intermedium TaxID=269621 RepID=A0A238FJ65_9BASI|nr:BQ2448_7120 [Microbotryum intermedium]
MLELSNLPTSASSSPQPQPQPQPRPQPALLNSPLFLAVDGGGSGVRAVIASHAGAELARASAGPCNVKSVTAPVAVARILQAVNAALALMPLSDVICHGSDSQPGTPEAVPSIDAQRSQDPLSLPRRFFAKVWVGVAGVDSRTEGSDFEDLLRHALRMPAEDLILTNGKSANIGYIVSADGYLFAAASTSLPHVDGTVVICAGTGSVSLAFRIQRTTREPQLVGCIGGWGPLLGDEGSAYSIGRLGVRSVLSYFDELHLAASCMTPTPQKASQPPLMFEDILRYFRAASSEGLIDRIYSDHSTPGAPLESESRRKLWIAESARIVLKHAFPETIACVESTRVALSILAEAQAHLVGVALRFVDQLQLDLHRTVLTLGGSLWTNSGFSRIYLEALEARECVFKHVIVISDAAGPAAAALAERVERAANATDKADEHTCKTKIDREDATNLQS